MQLQGHKSVRGSGPHPAELARLSIHPVLLPQVSSDTLVSITRGAERPASVTKS